MMLRMCSVLCLVMLLTISVSFGFETLHTVYIDGTVPIVADGILDDWASIPVTETEVVTQILKTRDEAEILPIDSPDDLSFSFKCFADDSFVYFALIVQDDNVIIDRNIFGKGWLDDSCTLYFDGDCVDMDKMYYDSNDGMLKVIGSKQGGVKYIEGLIPYFYSLQLPYFWESRGIRSGFQLTDSGYTVELAIPLAVLEWDSIYEGRTMGANLRVVDMDSEIDSLNVDKGLIWAEDPDHTAHFSATSFNRIVFSETVDSFGTVTKGTQVSVTNDGITVVLETPEMTDGEAVFGSVLNDLTAEDFTSAEKKLLLLQREIWAKPYLGIIQIRNGEAYTGVHQLIDFAAECPEPWGTEWVQAYLKNELEFLFKQYKDTVSDDIESLRDMTIVYDEYTKQYPDDSEGWYLSGQWAENSGNYEKAVQCFTKVDKSDEIEMYDLAQLRLAQNLFYLEQYDKAKDVVMRIKNSETSKQNKMQADMVLLSIDSK